MQPIKLKIQVQRDGEVEMVEVEGFTFDEAPGLVVHRAHDSEKWAVSHESGLSISDFYPAQEIAVAFLWDVKDAFDWTRSVEEIRLAYRELKDALDEARDRAWFASLTYKEGVERLAKAKGTEQERLDYDKEVTRYNS